MQYPHCDSLVLHAPGECEYCDEHPDWQELRIHWGIAFTGHDPVNDQVRCPAERRRPRETINRWGGNVVRPTPSHLRSLIADALEAIKHVKEGLS